jgi:DNA polymerase
MRVLTKKFIIPDYVRCQRCPLWQYRRNVVFGRGVVPANLLLIGEAPGTSEDLLGEAFVGPSGRLLNALLKRARELAEIRRLSMFITNVLACRPCDFKGGPNRQPQPEEIMHCTPRLLETISRVSPKRTVLLGQVARKVCSPMALGATVIDHPAYILRLGGEGCPAFIRAARLLSEEMSLCE